MLNQLYLYTSLFELLGEHEPDTAATNHGRGLDLVHVLKELCRQDIERRTGPHEDHLVIGLDGGGPVRDKQAVIAGDANDEDILGKRAVHNPPALNDGVLLDPVLELV